MNEINLDTVKHYVEINIGGFHSSRLTALKELKLSKVLERKNPYLFRAKNILEANELVKLLMEAHLSSQEEGMFGGFLEGLAIFVCSQTSGGRKSSTKGIDLEFDRDGIRYIVSIKSGPNWGNAGQITKMVENFKTAAKVCRQGNKEMHVVSINGCCYGRDSSPDKGDYRKLCGQEFWEFISGSPSLYLELIEPLGHLAREKNEEFQQSRASLLNLFVAEFIADYCTDGQIDWEKLVKFNSSKDKIKKVQKLKQNQAGQRNV